MNHELPDVQAGFRKGRGTRDKIASICWIIKKGREFKKKKSTSALLIMPKSLTVWITTNCGKYTCMYIYKHNKSCCCIPKTKHNAVKQSDFNFLK